jgi:RimJ/RimL family protein N-acetyltransferase
LKFFSRQRTEIVELNTERLVLRQWRNEDLPIIARVNADPEVMKYYPKLLSRQESNAAVEKFKSLISINGWGFWAVESTRDRTFVGLVGLHKPAYQLPFGPCVEIGWRLARACWGQGYATEAGRACLDFAFTGLQLPEVYAFTSVPNMKSRAVMERLNMENMQANFDHPTVPYNSPFREHVVYKIDSQQWRSDRALVTEQSQSGG